MRIAVIGCGVVGSSVAWHLAQRGADVIVIDGAGPGTGTSNWTFSWANASAKTETREYFDLNVAGLDAHYELAARMGGEWWHPSGHLRWHENEKASADLRATVDLLQSWGYDATIWDAGRVRRLLEPAIRFPSDDAEVAVFRDEGWVDGRALITRLIDEVSSKGGETHFGSSVVDVVTAGDRVCGVVLADDQRLEVDAVVNAAGPAAAGIAALVGRKLPMLDEPGFVARIRLDGAASPRRAMHSPHIELRPDGRDQLFLHSREVDALIGDGGEVSGLAEHLLRLGVDVLPSLERGELLATQVAWRPIPADRFPSVGGVGGIVGYYEAVTHSGITLCLVLGRFITEEILDGKVNVLASPYRPDRFG